MIRQLFAAAARLASSATSGRAELSMHRFGTRGLASLPIRRPRRFWDFHVPKTTWDYRPRITLRWEHTIARQHERDLAVRDWVTIPDARLPELWTCNWSHWRYWTNLHPLEAVLSTRYALDNEPLKPIVFSSFDHTTVFACAKTQKFYLYYGPRKYDEHEEMLYAFVGVFASVEAFIEEADWNQMEQVKPAGRIVDRGPNFPLRSVTYAEIPLMSTRGFRIAAEERYSKRTLWDMCPPAGTYMYQPRQDVYCFEIKPSEARRIREWPSIPDTQLPEPWSCNWSRFVGSLDWYDHDQDVALKHYGPELMGFVPALYVPLDPSRGDIVICPPGGAGTYYVWYNGSRDRSDPWGPWTGDMQRFEGVYASLEHFVRTADWNRLEGMAYRQPVSYD